MFPLCLTTRVYVPSMCMSPPCGLYIYFVWMFPSYVYSLSYVDVSFICMSLTCISPLRICVPFVYVSPPSVFPFHVYVPSVCMSSRCDVYVYFLCISPLCMSPPCICLFYTYVFFYVYVFSKHISTPYVYSFIAMFMFSTFWSQIWFVLPDFSTKQGEKNVLLLANMSPNCSMPICSLNWLLDLCCYKPRQSHVLKSDNTRILWLCPPRSSLFPLVNYKALGLEIWCTCSNH